MLERVVEAFPDHVFHTVISRTVRFPETTAAGEPITSYASNSRRRRRLPRARPRVARALAGALAVLFVLNKPALLLGIIAALYIGVVVGSAATVLVAKVLGDPMGQREHRLSLNPVRHVQIYSAVMMVLAGYGWAEQVPLNDRWRARRFHVAAAVLARPITYAALSLAAAAAAKGVTTLTGHGVGATAFPRRIAVRRTALQSFPRPSSCCR